MPTFREAFWVWLKVATYSFGGPAGQIAVMHKLVVEEKKWVSESRFLHALNYCMLLPGPEAQQLATYLSWLLHGTGRAGRRYSLHLGSQHFVCRLSGDDAGAGAVFWAEAGRHGGGGGDHSHWEPGAEEQGYGGHGSGHMLIPLAQRGYVLVGVDLSPQMGRRAARVLARAGLAGRVGLMRGRVQALPLADGQFACVLSQFPTPYILEPASLAAIWRVLATDGRLVILPEGHLTGRTWVHRFIAWLFAITGQTQAEPAHRLAELLRPFTEALTAADFTPTLHLIPLQGN